MQPLKFLPLALLLWSPFLSPPIFGDSPQGKTLILNPVAGSIWMLLGNGGNIAVCVGSEGLVIVDDQFAPEAPAIAEKLKGLKSGEVQFILNTHWHMDHTGGNEIFAKTGTVIAHEKVRTRLASPQEIFGKTIPASPKGALPILTFEQGIHLHFNGEHIEMVHFSGGHTDGDSVVFFHQSKVVHLGDHFFNGFFPFVDLKSGGRVQHLAENIRTLLTRIPDDFKIIPGHGPLASKNDLRSFLEMVEYSIAFMEKGIKAGETLALCQKRGLGPQYESWGRGFINHDQWLEIVFSSLKAGPSH